MLPALALLIAAVVGVMLLGLGLVILVRAAESRQQGDLCKNNHEYHS